MESPRSTPLVNTLLRPSPLYWGMLVEHCSALQSKEDFRIAEWAHRSPNRARKGMVTAAETRSKYHILPSVSKKVLETPSYLIAPVC